MWVDENNIIYIPYLIHKTLFEFLNDHSPNLYPNPCVCMLCKHLRLKTPIISSLAIAELKKSIINPPITPLCTYVIRATSCVSMCAGQGSEVCLTTVFCLLKEGMSACMTAAPSPSITVIIKGAGCGTVSKHFWRQTVLETHRGEVGEEMEKTQRQGTHRSPRPRCVQIVIYITEAGLSSHTALQPLLLGITDV